MPAGGGVRAGPKATSVAPSGAGPKDLRDRARHQPRSASLGRCGVSPLEGVAGDGKPAPAQGKTFPSRQTRIRPVLVILPELAREGCDVRANSPPLPSICVGPASHVLEQRILVVFDPAKFASDAAAVQAIVEQEERSSKGIEQAGRFFVVN